MRPKAFTLIELVAVRPFDRPAAAGRLRARQGKRVLRLRSGQAAFTLIELLVVVAIISLLVSILLPSLGRAKELARGVVCLHNLKQISPHMVFYADDHNGAYPPSIKFRLN